MLSTWEMHGPEISASDYKAGDKCVVQLVETSETNFHNIFLRQLPSNNQRLTSSRLKLLNHQESSNDRI